MNIDHPLGLVDMTNDAYHADDGISKSHLDCIRSGSPLHYWHKYLNPDREPEVKTPDLIMGSAIHAAILQPDIAEQLIVIGPAHDRRSNENKKAWAEFELEHMGQFILKPDQHDEVLHIRDTVWSHPVAPGLLTRGKAEQSFFALRDIPDGEGGVVIDHETGEIIQELVKCQTDFIRDDWDFIVDLKSTIDASPTGFAKSCANYRYPVQAAWYQDVLDAAFGRHPENWVIMALEKDKPYALGIYYFDEYDIERGRIAANRDYRLISACRRKNEWPDYGAQIQALQLPTWSKL